MNDIVYTVYKVTNMENNKFYIGVHKTRNIHDKYLGSGEGIKSAIKKYGRDSFVKEILFTYTSPEEAYLKESELVTESLVRSGMCYNRCIGGFGVGVEIANALGLNNKNKPPDYMNKMKHAYRAWVDEQRNNPKWSDDVLIKAYEDHGSVTKATTSLGSSSSTLRRRLSKLLIQKYGTVPTKPGPPKKL